LFAPRSRFHGCHHRYGVERLIFVTIGVLVGVTMLYPLFLHGWWRSSPHLSISQSASSLLGAVLALAIVVYAVIASPSHAAATNRGPERGAADTVSVALKRTVG
jgi:hypothetical protein